MRNVVASDKLRKRLAEEERRASIRESVLKRRQELATARTEQPSVKRQGSATIATRPRARITGLPQLAVTMDLAGVAGIVANKVGSKIDQEAIVTRLQQLVPDGLDGYGYLTWRYAAGTRPSPDGELRTTVHEDLAALAVVVDQEKQRFDALLRAHGSILEHPRLAKRGMDNEFRELLDADDIGRSAADELRRTRASFEFLRRAVVLTIACPEYDGRLWDTLEQLQPPPVERLVETSPQLERAIRRHSSYIDAVARILATDEANLDEFYRHSRVHLNALQERRYDFLRP